jgi:alpha-beta hydrolase superfamily lysophospholipase
MPYLEGTTGRVYYRRWCPPRSDAVIVFLHGYGEHSGFYHRLGHTLNRANIELFALDQIGHGLSEGARAVIETVDDLVENNRRLTALASSLTPGAPIFLMGHSMGAIAAALTVIKDPTPYRGAILSGSLLSPVPWVLDLVVAGEAATLELELAQLSSDPFYLDEVENDPLAFVTNEGAKSLARIIPPAWTTIAERFGDVQLPILFVHGEFDVLGPVDDARAWASRLPHADIKVFEGQRHDILNERVHDDVARRIVDFVSDLR